MIRKSTGKHKIVGMLILGCTICIVGMAAVRVQAQSELQQSIAEKILRFHVRANSDSKADQELKLAVRDAIGDVMTDMISEAENLEDSKKTVEENMDMIIATAEEVITEAGYDYSVNAQLAMVEFPEKSYGAYTFPAGTYEALEIEIGTGEGQNWWCVLYPNMCFQNSVYEVVDAKADEALREVLTTEEYKAVFDSEDIEVRFKFLEYFQ